MGHLFNEFNNDVRNEYEHPSLEPQITGNIIMWGDITIDRSGDIKAHAGKNLYATIKSEHCNRMQNLRTELIDIFLKHFSQKPLTKQLIEVRNQIEENIDSIISELLELVPEEDPEKFNEQLYSLIMYDLSLMKHGVSLSASTKEKINTAIFEKIGGTYRP